MTVEEILAFFGVVIAMGVTNLPQVFDYWSTEAILSTPWYSSIFSRTRFLQIKAHGKSYACVFMCMVLQVRSAGMGKIGLIENCLYRDNSASQSNHQQLLDRCDC